MNLRGQSRIRAELDDHISKKKKDFTVTRAYQSDHAHLYLHFSDDSGDDSNFKGLTGSLAEEIGLSRTIGLSLLSPAADIASAVLGCFQDQATPGVYLRTRAYERADGHAHMLT